LQTPLFSEESIGVTTLDVQVPLAASGLTPDQIRAGTEVLNSGQLTMGARVREFESLLGDFLGVEHVVMVNSGSSANLAAVEALVRPALGVPKLLPGDTVLVPAIAWPTTVWPLIQLGLKPYFVDVRSDDFSMDISKAEEAVLSLTVPPRAAMIIHPLGHPVPQSDLVRLENLGLTVVSDVCESLGARVAGRHAGAESAISTYSFYFSHHITTMEGGAVATNDRRIADDLRSIRSHGWTRDRSDRMDWESDASANQRPFLFAGTGFNVRPTELSAALGVVEMPHLGRYVARRNEIAERCRESLVHTPFEMRVPHSDRTSARAHSWMHIPISCKDSVDPQILEKVLPFLASQGVETRPVLTGNFLRQPVISQLGLSQLPADFPVADEVANSTFLVGSHHSFSEEQLKKLTSALSALAEI
jgi:CDP-6-deoxy-D-xylo-4-hexulose-3-dehydrase